MGRVVLECVITPEGRATNIKILESLGTDFDESVVKAVSVWRFKPATGPDGKPAAVSTIIEATFKLL
jgi:TonB family protein